MRRVIVTFARFLLNRFDTEITAESRLNLDSFHGPKITREYIIEKLQSSGKIDLSYSNLSGVDLSQLDLRQVKFTECNLRYTLFQECDLRTVDFSRAYCRQADFSKANLALADLTDTYLREANLSDASLYRAKLDGANLHNANLHKANLHRASFQGTKVQLETLGHGILQDSDDNYERFLHWTARFYTSEKRKSRPISQLQNRLIHAEQVYRSLKIAFTNDGQYGAASWAYIRERQIRRQKHWLTNAKHNFQHEFPHEGRWRFWRKLWFYGKHLSLWLLDWTAESTCGYGEKPLRTLALSLVILLVFPFLYAWIGGINSTAGAMTALDYFNYSLAAFTTLGFSEFEATTAVAQTLTSLEALLGISILALLMFVLGNRISRV